MDSESYAAFRAKWQTNHARAARPQRTPEVKEVVAERHTKYRREWIKAMIDDTPRVILSRKEYDAIRDATLKGMTVYASEDQVNSQRFKVIRAAWSKLAPVQTEKHFLIEVAENGD